MAEASQATGETSTDFNRFNPYGPGSAADDTRQAQQREANDAIADVNMNDVFSRSQATTIDIAGKEFTSNSDVRQKLQDQFLGRLGAK